MDKTLAWLWLADAVGSACQNARDLLALYPDPEALYEALRAGREAPPYFLSDHAVAQLYHCLLTGVEFITPDDAAYPDRLRDLPDMPLVLYVTGESACLNGHRYVGMVGTRRPSAYGRQAAFDLSLEMAKQGAVIVSGCVEGLLGLSAKYWRRFVSPIVSACVVTTIGFSLLSTGISSFASSSVYPTGAWQNLLVAVITLGFSTLPKIVYLFFFCSFFSLPFCLMC